MDALALQHPDKLTVLHITELPVGWLGKTHAMAQAASHAISAHHPDYLLFTDADILFHADAIRLALAQAIATQADHFILLPTAIIKSAGEGMLLSYLQIMGLWAVRTWRVSDPKALRDAVGVGAFNLLRTPVYQQLGGFEALRMEIVEDLTLGSRVKQHRLRQRIASGPGLVRVHWAQRHLRNHQRHDEKSLRHLSLQSRNRPSLLPLHWSVLHRSRNLPRPFSDSHPGDRDLRLDRLSLRPLKPPEPRLPHLRRPLSYQRRHHRLLHPSLDDHHPETRRRHLARHLLPPRRPPKKNNHLSLSTCRRIKIPFYVHLVLLE